MASLKDTESAFSIQGGKVWVSVLNTPDSPSYQERYRGQSLVVFTGVDRLELTVDNVRALRDWLTSVLPDDQA